MALVQPYANKLDVEFLGQDGTHHGAEEGSIYGAEVRHY